MSNDDDFPLKGDIGKAFSKIVQSSFEKYLGCLIEKVKRGDQKTYRWLGKSYDTLEEVKKVIDEGYDELDKSINRLKK